MNHPFLDGNKRVAVAATIASLAINRVDLTAEADGIHQFIIESLESGLFSHTCRADWLRESRQVDEEMRTAHLRRS